MKTFAKISTASKFATIALFVLIALATSLTIEAQQSDSLTLRVPFRKGHKFDVARSDLKVKIDIEGFEATYDSQPDDKVLVVAGHSERHMVVKITVDTLYTDLEPSASEYRELWWYFYMLDSTLDVGNIRTWNEDGDNWSTHTILTSNSFDINERHYDLFQIKDNHSFHVSIKRPLYLEGDSTLMLGILNSFEVIAPDSTK